MEIKVVHEIKFDTKSANLLELVASAILGSMQQGSSSVEQETKPKTSPAKAATPKAENKPAEASENKVADPKPATEEKQTELKEEATEAEKTEVSEASTVGEVTLDIADLRVVASKFVGAGKQKELKALFGEFSDGEGEAATKLSAIQSADFQKFLDRAKERLAELGIGE